MKWATFLLATAIAAASYQSCACADLVSFSLELNSGGNSKVVIDNRSSPGWAIGWFTVDFRAANVILDTTLSDGIGTDPVDQATSFLSSGTFGSFGTVVSATGLACYQNAGDLSGLKSDVNQGSFPGQLMTFSFSGSGLAPGDGWGFNVDWDKAGTNDNPRGSDINGTKVTALFVNLANPGLTQELTYTYTGVQGNGFSFPALISADAVPEPGALLPMAFMAACSARRRRRSRLAREGHVIRRRKV